MMKLTPKIQSYNESYFKKYIFSLSKCKMEFNIWTFGVLFCTFAACIEAIKSINNKDFHLG